jgi:hypothetical protein
VIASVESTTARACASLTRRIAPGVKPVLCRSASYKLCQLLYPASSATRPAHEPGRRNSAMAQRSLTRVRYSRVDIPY